MSGRAYSHALHAEALEALFGLKLAERRRVMDDCAALVRDPAQESDYTRKDATGRIISHVIRGRFAIAYWVDHGERLVWILRVDQADH